MAQTLVIDGLKRRTLPINLRQSGNSDAQMLISARIRKSPWWHLSKAAGCWTYTTYNYMYHPRAYIKPEDGGLFAEYKYLTEHVSIWDVAVERQIQIKGPDAADFVNMLITRDVHTVVPTMQARYVILCNQYGGIINDPVLLRVADDEFWFSISDSDLLLWAQGVNSSGKFDVDIHEIDVSPVPQTADSESYPCGFNTTYRVRVGTCEEVDCSGNILWAGERSVSAGSNRYPHLDDCQ